MSRKKISLSDKVKKTISPKTKNQEDYIRSMCENTITIGEGCSGNGKTMLAIYLACTDLLAGKIKNILITRSIVGCGKDIGSLPGRIPDKTDIYFKAQLEYLELFLGKAELEEFRRYGMITLIPTELLRGNTFLDTVMILDEAQNCSIQQIRLFMSRIGHGSKIVMIGDTGQSDTDFRAFGNAKRVLSDADNIGVIDFGYHDIQRHPIIGPVLSLLENVGN